MVDTSSILFPITGWNRYNIYGTQHPLISASTKTSVKVGAYTYERTESQTIYKIDLKPKKQLSPAAMSFVQQIQASANLSDAEKNKLIEFIAKIDAYDGFVQDTDGKTSLAVSMMIRASEQANELKQKKFSAMDPKHSSELIKQTLEKNDHREDQSYILSTRLIVERLLHEMKGQMQILSESSDESYELTKIY